MCAIHSTKISGNFGWKLNGSVRSDRKGFKKTGPPILGGPLFPVGIFGWMDHASCEFLFFQNESVIFRTTLLSWGKSGLTWILLYRPYSVWLFTFYNKRRRLKNLIFLWKSELKWILLDRAGSVWVFVPDIKARHLEQLIIPGQSQMKCIIDCAGNVWLFLFWNKSTAFRST